MHFYFDVAIRCFICAMVVTALMDLHDKHFSFTWKKVFSAAMYSIVWPFTLGVIVAHFIRDSQIKLKITSRYKKVEHEFKSKQYFRRIKLSDIDNEYR